MKKKINRSEVIREYLKTCKDQSPTAIVEALAKKGVKVSPGLVSVVKNLRRRKPGSSPLERHAKMLGKAHDFVAEVGGHKKAKELIDLVKRIVS